MEYTYKDLKLYIELVDDKQVLFMLSDQWKLQSEKGDFNGQQIKVLSFMILQKSKEIYNRLKNKS